MTKGEGRHTRDRKGHMLGREENMLETKGKCARQSGKAWKRCKE